MVGVEITHEQTVIWQIGERWEDRSQWFGPSRGVKVEQGESFLVVGGSNCCSQKGVLGCKDCSSN
jgi:hypothetical protein